MEEHHFYSAVLDLCDIDDLNGIKNLVGAEDEKDIENEEMDKLCADFKLTVKACNRMLLMDKEKDKEIEVISSQLQLAVDVVTNVLESTVSQDKLAPPHASKKNERKTEQSKEAKAIEEILSKDKNGKVAKQFGVLCCMSQMDKLSLALRYALALGLLLEKDKFMTKPLQEDIATQMHNVLQAVENRLDKNTLKTVLRVHTAIGAVLGLYTELKNGKTNPNALKSHAACAMWLLGFGTISWETTLNLQFLEADGFVKETKFELSTDLIENFKAIREEYTDRLVEDYGPLEALVLIRGRVTTCLIDKQVVSADDLNKELKELKWKTPAELAAAKEEKKKKKEEKRGKDGKIITDPSQGRAKIATNFKSKSTPTISLPAVVSERASAMCATAKTLAAAGMHAEALELYGMVQEVLGARVPSGATASGGAKKAKAKARKVKKRTAVNAITNAFD